MAQSVLTQGETSCSKNHLTNKSTTSIEQIDTKKNNNNNTNDDNDNTNNDNNSSSDDSSIEMKHFTRGTMPRSLVEETDVIQTECELEIIKKH